MSNLIIFFMQMKILKFFFRMSGCMSKLACQACTQAACWFAELFGGNTTCVSSLDDLVGLATEFLAGPADSRFCPSTATTTEPSVSFSFVHVCMSLCLCMCLCVYVFVRVCIYYIFFNL
jgi:hypothetical protein